MVLRVVVIVLVIRNVLQAAQLGTTVAADVLATARLALREELVQFPNFRQLDARTVLFIAHRYRDAPDADAAAAAPMEVVTCTAK